jgi:hypothetical protein
VSRARIVANLGEGLYQIEQLRNWTRVDREIEELTEQQLTHFQRLLDALNTLDDLRRTKAEAAEGLYAVIDQWKAALISKLNEEPPAIIPDTPIDPETGLPWADTDRAQDGPLLTAINAERATAGRDALSRADELDAAILRHLRYAAVTGQTTHYDTDGGGAARARKAGYNYDLTIGVGQIQSFGQRTAAATVAYWMRTSNDRSRILDAAYTECGVAYVYAPKNPYTYLWGVLFATPGAPLPDVEDAPDPAERAAKDSDAALERITLPTIETFEPDKLGAAAAELARAAQRVRVAETAVSKLRVEDWSRTQRLNELNALKTNTAAPVDAWCCRYIDDIPINAELWVAEVPGFPMPDATPRTVTMGTYSQTTPRTVAYSERSINILPPQNDDFGTLHPVNNMTPSQAFLAAAMEPGVIRWKPLFRYAVIQAMTGTTCTIDLEQQPIRKKRGSAEVLVLDAHEQRVLSSVPINYPPCGASAFKEGDAVLVFFDYDRNTPLVIGFRREPVPCPARVSWQQLR